VPAGKTYAGNIPDQHNDPGGNYVWPMQPRQSELRRTFRISITEGVFSQVYGSLAGPGSAFLTRLLVFLGAGPLHFSLLSAIGQVSMLFQPLGIIAGRGSTLKKQRVIGWAAAGRSLTPLLGLAPLLLPRSLALPGVLAVFFVITSILAVSTNMWMGWIAHMVPRKIRGRFFAKRNAVLMTFGLIVSFAFGMWLDAYGTPPTGAGALVARVFSLSPDGLPRALLATFVTAGVLGIAGLLILRRQPERMEPETSDTLGSTVLEPLRDPNFRRLCFFGAWWMMAVGVGAPFWQPFMIQVLGMGLVEMLLYGAVSTAGAVLTLRYWGRLIDSYGNKTAMKLAIIAGSVIPLVWLFVTRETRWLLVFEAAASGSMWGCVGVVTANLVLAVAPRGREQAYSGLYSAVCGLAMIFTMLASGVFMPGQLRILGHSLHPMQVLFLATAFARLSAEIPLRFVEEPDAVGVSVVLRRFLFWNKVRFPMPRVFFRSGKDR